MRTDGVGCVGGLGRRDAGGRERGRALGVGGWHWVLCLARVRGPGGGGGAAGCAGCGGGGETLNASTRRSDGCGRGGAWRSPGFECGRNRFVCSTGGSSARTEAGGSPGPAPGVAGVFRSRARGPRARPRVNLHESQSEAESAQCGCPMRAAAPSPPSATCVSRLASRGPRTPACPSPTRGAHMHMLPRPRVSPAPRARRPHLAASRRFHLRSHRSASDPPSDPPKQVRHANTVPPPGPPRLISGQTPVHAVLSTGPPLPFPAISPSIKVAHSSLPSL